ncbi:MAG: Flp family type IVb pilin [Acidimicrobiia bacterium]
MRTTTPATRTEATEARGAGDRGATLVDYTLVVALVAIVALASLRILGIGASDSIAAAAEGISPGRGAAPAAGAPSDESGSGGTGGAGSGGSSHTGGSGSGGSGSGGGGSSSDDSTGGAGSGGSSTPGEGSSDGSGSGGSSTSGDPAPTTTTVPDQVLGGGTITPPATGPKSPTPVDGSGKAPAGVQGMQISAGNGSLYWWDAHGARGQWKAGFTFSNSGQRHAYLTLEITKVWADGSTETSTVSGFYVPANGTAPYEVWSLDLVEQGKPAENVSAVTVKVVKVLTSDANWQPYEYAVAEPTIAIVGAPTR